MRKNKKAKLINAVVCCSIFVSFFVLLMLKYRLIMNKFIAAIVLLSISGTALCFHIFLLIHYLRKTAKEKKNRNLFLTAVDLCNEEIFSEFAKEIINHRFEEALRSDPVILENVVSYEVAVGFSQQKEPAFYVRLHLVTKDMLYLYCEKNAVNLCYVSALLKCTDEEEISYKESSNYFDFQEKIIRKIRNKIKK